ncbi:aminoglycoside phosphotransferase family protein [Paenibacillus sp. NPDC058071]|uniref:aminoglycoside phosphotransferase family protein n=1 Tax=Paenibacillus sp. NPDC058071 TaxID=3346326 RepID=UPI0036D877F4
MQLPSPFGLSYNFVAPAVMEDGTEAVLKLSVPGRENRLEHAALQAFSGRGGVKVLEADLGTGALLLERVAPGRMLADAVRDDDEATVAAARLMLRTEAAAPAGNEAGDGETFPSVAEWAAGLRKVRLRFDGGTGPLSERMVRRAEETFERLLAVDATAGTGASGDAGISTTTTTTTSPRKQLLLHGDLHHYNILSAPESEGGWIAIDPKGVIGEAEYGTIPLLLNKLPEHPGQQRDVLRRRVELLCSELSLDRTRLLEWGFSHSVLSAWWCLEDGVGDPLRTMEQAKRFEELLAE